jgi:hypothetical protein
MSNLLLALPPEPIQANIASFAGGFEPERRPIRADPDHL